MDLEMEKFILHFGEDPDQKDIYNLIVKVEQLIARFLIQFPADT